ncbi:MAG: glycosyltransferase family 2 protein [Chloroflexia bacterium]
MSHIMQEMQDTQPTSRLYSTSVVVVSYNTAAYIESCLLSILELDYPQVEIIVVDNGSTDGSVDLVRRRFPDVELVELQENKGFAGGASVGLYMAAGDIVATVNPDVKLDPDWMSIIVETLLSDEHIGIVGSKILYPDGKTIQHAGGVVHYPLATTEHIGRGEPDIGQYNQPKTVQFVTGAALAMRREVGRALRFFDEAFFPVFYEDVDLCRRAEKLGLRVLYQPRAIAYHKESVTLDHTTGLYYSYYHANRLRYIIKHYSPEQVMLDFLPAEAKRLSGVMPEEDRKASLFLLDNRLATENESVEPSIGRKWDNLHEHVGEVMGSWRVRERPFSSSAPLIGPLVARLRSRVNNLSTRWYVQPILQQQVDHNASVARTLREMSDQLAELQAQVALQSLLIAGMISHSNSASQTPEEENEELE